MAKQVRYRLGAPAPLPGLICGREFEGGEVPRWGRGRKVAGTGDGLVAREARGLEVRWGLQGWVRVEPGFDGEAGADGSYVYFVADGILETSPGSSKQVAGAVHGDCGLGVSDLGVGAVCNVYVRHGGVTRLVAVLSAGDLPDWRQELARNASRVSPDGRWLAFMSDRSLTGYDNEDVTGHGRKDEEVFEYHAPQNLEKESGTLTCVSCDPTGARPVEAE